MKKSILAVAIPALMAASSVSAYEILATDAATLDFYGELRAKIADDDTDKSTYLDSYVDALGIKASYNAMPGLDVIGLFEVGTDSDEDNSGNDGDVNYKKSYVGMTGDFGTVTFGKQNLPMDAMGAASLGYNYDEASKANTRGATSGDSAVDYEYLDEMFWFNVGYNAGEGAENNPEVFQVAAGVTVDTLTVRAAYSDQASADIENWGIDAIYGLGDITLGAQYFTQDDANDDEGYGVGVAYNYGMGNVFGGYELEDLNDVERDTIYLGVDYRFNANSRVFAEYGFEDPENGDDANKYNVGLRLYW